MERKAGGILICALLALLLTAVTVAASPMFIATARNLRGALYLGYGPSPHHASETALAKCSQDSVLPFSCKVLEVRMELPPPPPPPPWAVPGRPITKGKPYHPTKGSPWYGNAPIRPTKSYRSHSSKSKRHGAKSARKSHKPKAYVDKSTHKSHKARVYADKAHRADAGPKIRGGTARREKETVRSFSGKLTRRADKPREYVGRSDLYLDGSKRSSERTATDAKKSNGSRETLSQRFRWGRTE
jgi:hypothetical protein